MIPRAWQSQFLQNIQKNKFSLVMGCRGAGKDWALQMVCLGLLEAGEDITIVNKTEALNKNYIRGLRRLSKELTVPTEGNVLELRHKSSEAVITATSGRVDSLQGRHNTVILNELGALDDAEEAINYALGSVASRHESRLIIATNSTPPGTWLHKFFEEEGERWRGLRELFAHQNVTIDDVYPEGLPPSVQVAYDAFSDAGRRRWFYNQFVVDESPLVPSEFLRSTPPPDWRRTTPRVMGVDIGSVKDATAIVVLGKHLGTWSVLHQERVWGLSLNEITKRILEVRAAWGVGKVAVDVGGIGLGVSQSLKRFSWFVPMSMSRKFYETQPALLRQRIIDGNLQLNGEVLEELPHASWREGRLEKCYLTVGKNRSHLDLVDALLLASSLVSERTNENKGKAQGTSAGSLVPISFPTLSF